MDKDIKEILVELSELELARWSQSGGEWWDKNTETLHKIPDELALILIHLVVQSRIVLSKK